MKAAARAFTNEGSSAYIHLVRLLRLGRKQQSHRVPEPGEKTRPSAHERTNTREWQPWRLPRDRRPRRERRRGDWFERSERRCVDARLDRVKCPGLPALQGRRAEPAVTPGVR
jgi:hypothetical protein